MKQGNEHYVNNVHNQHKQMHSKTSQCSNYRIYYSYFIDMSAKVFCHNSAMYIIKLYSSYFTHHQ